MDGRRRGQIVKDDYISIKWLHKELIELIYKRKLSSEVMAIFNELIAKWRRENEDN